LARRLQHGDRRRAVLSVLAVAGGVLLVLATSALFAGFHSQETAYLDRSPAQLVLSQRGVSTMQLSLSVLGDDVAERAQRVDGVAWAEGIRHVTATVGVAGREQLVSYVFGFDTASGRGGPQMLARGELPGMGEVVVDRAGASQLGIGIGDELDVFGVPLRVSGVTEGLTSLANTTVFLADSQFAALAGPGTSYVLVGAEQGLTDEEVADRVARALPDVQVQTREAFIAQEAALVRDMYTAVIRTMQLIGVVVAYALIALSLSMATAASRASFGVVRALGGSIRLVRCTVLAQAVWIVLGAVAIAIILVLALATAVTSVAPNVLLLVTLRDVATTAVLALAVGMAAALAPLQRVAGVEPAAAFRQGT
jgi:putative ABC transport system permease protein